MRLRPVLSLAAAALFLPLPASAQFSVDGDEDIIINAEKATYRGRQTILEGKVDVKQGDATIQSDKMNIYRADASQTATEGLALGEVTLIEAEGNFVYITPESTVKGNRGVYERLSGIITVTGNVTVVQKSGSTASTDKLIYNVKTETIRFTGNCVGQGCGGRSTLRIE